MAEKQIKWKVPKKRQPVWVIFRQIFKPFFRIKSLEFLGEEFPKKCIILANHYNKKGPMLYELRLPVKHVTWGAYQMLGSYKMRFKYLRDVLYMQKNHFSKGKATRTAWFEAIFSLRIYRGMKMLPSFPDARFRKPLQYSMECLDKGFSISLFPENSSEGYFDELKSFYPGFVMLAEQYYKKTGEDLPIFPMYYGRKKNKIVVGKPLYVQNLAKQGLKRDEIAQRFCEEVNELYRNHFKE